MADGRMHKLEKFKRLYNLSMKDTACNFVYHFRDQFENINFERKNILEVGCGKAFLSLYIALFTNVATLTSLDENAGDGSEVGVLNILCRNLKYFGMEKRIKIIESDILAYNSNLFDIIIANNCLHHVVDNGQLYWVDSNVRESYQIMLRHLFSLLCDEGLLVIVEMDPFNVWRFLFPKLFFPKMNWRAHAPINAWLDALKKCGFIQVDKKTVVPYKLRLFRRIINRKIFRPFLMGGVIIYSKKYE